VDRAWAPGVSAPATGGLRVPTWLDAAYHAGRCARVRSADVVELNPAVDRDGQTAALAALTVWWIWKGLADRALAPPMVV
jgi:arginase family enzyme